MAVIMRSTHPSHLWPGIKGFFGQTYRELEKVWSQIFEEDTSDKAYEELVEATGFGMAPIKPEGDAIQYDTDAEGYKQRLTHLVYALGYIVTREELEDNQYRPMSERRSRALSFSMNQTAETVHANILNRAFNTSYNGGDGKPLLASDHPTLGGAQSNILGVAADFSETALEDALTSLMTMKNARGLQINVKARRLIIHPSLAFEATRILESDLRAGTANNDVNAVRSMGMLPGGVVINPYLTDPDAWFIQTDVPNGLTSLWRRKVDLEKDNEFDTHNAKAQASMRFAAGWGDWRALFGTPGAA